MKTVMDKDVTNTNITLEEKPKTSGYLKIKYALDRVIAFCAIVLLFPFLLIIAGVIYIDDPKGSPIYSQRRIGYNGRGFILYKFRTMVIHAEQQQDLLMNDNESDGPVFKIKDDPRITRVGRFLRQTSLDELPQLWNVLKGDMSIVGPRPPLPNEVDTYTEHQMRRLSVKPGLTCYWQTQPNRNDLPFSQWVEMDLEYIEDQSASVDLRLVFKTITVMLRREGR